MTATIYETLNVKMAHLCGKRAYPPDWNPAENLAQAKECLHALLLRGCYAVIEASKEHGSIAIFGDTPGPLDGCDSEYPISREALVWNKEALGICHALENIYDNNRDMFYPGSDEEE